MSIAHVIHSIVTQKKHENQKNFRHIDIMIFTTFFVNRFFRIRYKKKVNSRYNTQKKFIIHGLSKYVKTIERLYLIIILLAILSKMCTDLGILRCFFLCANAIIITFKNNMCSKRFFG